MTDLREVSRRALFTNAVTPVEDHHVSQQGDVPDVDADGWTVSVTGDAERAAVPVARLVDEYPSVTVMHTMECAGNGRAFLDADGGDPPWGVGGVSTALWTGAPLDVVLDRHGAPDDAWVTMVGADRPTDDTVFARSIPASKAREDCVLAYAMNGDPLPREHGAPIRVVVPGWYGVNSVKWLTEVRVTDRMPVGRAQTEDGVDDAYWQQDAYRLTPRGETPTHRENVDTYDTREQRDRDDVEHPYTFDQHVKSVIGHPEPGATVRPRDDGHVEVLGMAWAGDDAVDTVDVSTDGGDTWREATFVSPPYPGAWRLFRFLWTPDPGTYTLASRATDEHGRTQPARVSGPVASWDEVGDDEYPWNEDGYGVNAVRPHAVDVTVVT